MATKERIEKIQRRLMTLTATPEVVARDRAFRQANAKRSEALKACLRVDDEIMRRRITI